MLNSTPSCGLLSLISFPQGFLVFCHDFFTLHSVQCILKQKTFYLLNLSYLASSVPYFFILLLFSLLKLFYFESALFEGLFRIFSMFISWNFLYFLYFFQFVSWVLYSVLLEGSIQLSSAHLFLGCNTLMILIMMTGGWWKRKCQDWSLYLMINN